MPSVTVKSIPTDLYERLMQAAAANRRSLNSEIIVCIERAVGPERVDVEDTVARLCQLRERTPGHQVAGEEFNAAKRDGRP
jgi:hypothetical protein